MLAAVNVNSSLSLADLHITYDGIRQPEAVEEFILRTSVYRSVHRISDANALRSLPLLFTGEASTWWQGVNQEAATWVQAMNLIRSAFAPAKPRYKLYKELFWDNQQVNETIDSFVCRKRAILAQITHPVHNEATQLDMVYGMLSLHIRDRKSRDSIETFNDLLRAGRQIETLLQEAGTSTYTNPPATAKKQKPKCSFCHYIGHDIKECRKKQAHDLANPPTPELKPVACYGCGKPGVTKINCPDCRLDTPHKDRAFYLVHGRIGAEVLRIQLKINGCDEVAIIDTGARTSVLSEALYQHLRNSGSDFSAIVANISLADGSHCNQQIWTTKANVELKGQNWLVDFVAFPKAIDNRTLLGIDFLLTVGMVLHLPQLSWSLYNDPDTWYDYDNKITQPNTITSAVRRLSPTSVPSRNQEPSNEPSSSRQEATESLDTSLTGISKIETPFKRINPFAAPHSSKIPRKEPTIFISRPKPCEITMENALKLKRSPVIPVSPLKTTPTILGTMN